VSQLSAEHNASIYIYRSNIIIIIIIAKLTPTHSSKKKSLFQKKRRLLLRVHSVVNEVNIIKKRLVNI